MRVSSTFYTKLRQDNPGAYRMLEYLWRTGFVRGRDEDVRELRTLGVLSFEGNRPVVDPEVAALMGPRNTGSLYQVRRHHLGFEEHLGLLLAETHAVAWVLPDGVEIKVPKDLIDNYELACDIGCPVVIHRMDPRGESVGLEISENRRYSAFLSEVRQWRERAPQPGTHETHRDIVGVVLTYCCMFWPEWGAVWRAAGLPAQLSRATAAES